MSSDTVGIAVLPLGRILIEGLKAKCWEGVVLQRAFALLFNECCVSVRQVGVGMRHLRDAHASP